MLCEILNILSTISTPLVAIFTLLLAIFTFLMWKAYVATGHYIERDNVIRYMESINSVLDSLSTQTTASNMSFENRKMQIKLELMKKSYGTDFPSILDKFLMKLKSDSNKEPFHVFEEVARESSKGE